MKTILITGATSGIGSAIALELINSNSQLILTSRSTEKLSQLAESLNGTPPTTFSADLSSRQGINGLIQKIKENLTTLDILINVAGIWHTDDKVLAGISYEDFDQKTVIDTLNVGTLAPMLLAHALIPIMPKKGKIVNISGTFESGAKGWLPYYVSKRAIEDLTIGLAEELQDKDIQVNCISPSDTATEAYKKHFSKYIDDAIEPSVIAKQVAYLCSTKADNITGKVYVVKKGQEPYESFHT